MANPTIHISGTDYLSLSSKITTPSIKISKSGSSYYIPLFKPVGTSKTYEYDGYIYTLGTLKVGDYYAAVSRAVANQPPSVRIIMCYLVNINGTFQLIRHSDDYFFNYDNACFLLAQITDDDYTNLTSVWTNNNANISLTEYNVITNVSNPSKKYIQLPIGGATQTVLVSTDASEVLRCAHIKYSGSTRPKTTPITMTVTDRYGLPASYTANIVWKEEENVVPIIDTFKYTWLEPNNVNNYYGNVYVECHDNNDASIESLTLKFTQATSDGREISWSLSNQSSVSEITVNGNHYKDTFRNISIPHPLYEHPQSGIIGWIKLVVTDKRGLSAVKIISIKVKTEGTSEYIAKITVTKGTETQPPLGYGGGAFRERDCWDISVDATTIPNSVDTLCLGYDNTAGRFYETVRYYELPSSVKIYPITYTREYLVKKGPYGEVIDNGWKDTVTVVGTTKVVNISSSTTTLTVTW